MKHLTPWIPRLAGQRVLVVGDLILDEYVLGQATRISREAPIPVLEFASRQYVPGGAANPSANIANLGSSAVQVGVIGADVAATNLRQVLQVRGIDTGSLIVDSSRPTTLKTRILAQMGLRFPQQVARIDTLSREPIRPAVVRALGDALRQQAGQAQALLVSDYQGGLLTADLIEAIRNTAAQHKLLLTADTQGELDKYLGFDLVKCNADEARAYLGVSLVSDDDFTEAARQIAARLRLRVGMVITRGADGATISAPSGQVEHCPAPAVTDVYDVVGAGDTTIAVLTLALLAQAPLAEATMLANYASGLVVRRVGNYAPTPDELARALEEWPLT